MVTYKFVAGSPRAKYTRLFYASFLLAFLLQSALFGLEVVWIYLHGQTLWSHTVLSASICLLPLVLGLYFNYPKTEDGHMGVKPLGKVFLGLTAFLLPVAGIAGYYLNTPQIFPFYVHLLTYFLVVYIDVLLCRLFYMVRIKHLWDLNFQHKCGYALLPVWVLVHLCLLIPFVHWPWLSTLFILCTAAAYLAYLYPLVHRSGDLRIMEHLVLTPPEDEAEDGYPKAGGPGTGISTVGEAGDGGTARSKENYETIIRKLEQVMEEEQLFLNEEVNLGHLSREIGTNKTYLSQAINLHYQMNFNTLVNTYRVNMAKSLILDLQRLPMQDIARRVGFKTLSCFNEAFKRSNGLTPTEWRDKEAGLKTKRRRPPVK